MLLTTPASSPPNLVRLRELCHNLESEEQYLLNFFVISPDLLAIINTDGMFTNINPSWHELLGWSDNELRERSLFGIVHPDDRKVVEEIVSYLVVRGPQLFMCQLMCSDGSVRVVEFSVTKCSRGRSNLLGRIISDKCLHCAEAIAKGCRGVYDCTKH